MKRKKSKIRIVINNTFACILTLLIVILYLSLGFSFGVFNDRSILSKLDESQYYDMVYDNYYENAVKMLQESGFPKQVLEEAVPFDKIYVGGKNYVNNILAGEAAQINTIKLRNALTDSFNRYLTEQGIVRTNELNTGIEVLISELENNYVDSIQLQFVNYYKEYKSKFLDLMKIAIPLDLILIGLLCFFLIRMHRFKHRGMRYINYASIASSCLILVTAIYLLLIKKYMAIDVNPKYYQKFLTAYFKWDIIVFLYIGGSGLTISAFLITLTGYLRKKVANG